MTALAAALVASAALAAPALATHDYIGVRIGTTGEATVGAASTDISGNDPHVEISRGGALLARSTGPGFGGLFGAANVPSLLAGDVISLHRNGAAFASVTFDGLPTVNADACAGRTAFTGARNAAASVDYAGFYTPGGGGYGSRGSVHWNQGNPFTVTLPRPLIAGQVVYVATNLVAGAGADTMELDVERNTTVAACPSPPPPPVPPTVVPTDGQVFAAIKAALGKTAAKLRKLDTAALAKRKRLTLPFRFAEAGTVRLQLKRKTTAVGTGTKTLKAPGSANVTVKLTKAGRSLLKRAKSIKLTLKATFTPARAGAKPQAASMSVTLKRKKKK
jgi:hypothetical protein